MTVRIRFGRGRTILRRKGRNGQLALLVASLLTLVSISFGVFGFWRLGEDLGFAGDFVFPTGLLSHWQVWMAAAAASQYACWVLTRYSKRAGGEADDADDDSGVVVDDGDVQGEAAVQKATARV